jgi:hypothetical protein
VSTKRNTYASMLLAITIVLMMVPHGNAASTGLPTTIYLYAQPPFGCAVCTYSAELPRGSLLNIYMVSDQTIYLYLMTPETFADWSYRHQCNNPGPNILLYETIPTQLGYTLHWTAPYDGSFYFVFEYDWPIPPYATVHLIDKSSIPSQG